MLSYFLKKRLKKHDAVNNLHIKSLVQAAMLQQAALTQETPGTGNDKPHDIVISLTSYDKRIEDIYLCIESLFQQSLKADRIILWLSRLNFSDEVIPEILSRQKNRGLEIIFVDEDLGPYKKFYYAFQQFPDSLIITVDDDILYPPDTVDMLYRAYRKNPNYVYCHRAHEMVFDQRGQLKPYQQWNSGHIDSAPSFFTLPTGMGGVLYPPGALDEEVLNKDQFTSLCPNADDIWLKAMSLRKETKCVKLQDSRHWKERFLTISGSQQNSLKKQNWQKKNGNDSKIKATFNEYGIYPLLQQQLNRKS